MNSYIYLDHAASSPMHDNVIDAMTTAMQQVYGNASSIHGIGREARKYLDNAREILAQSIGAQPGEIIITSGGTEADNTAILVLFMHGLLKGSILLPHKLNITRCYILVKSLSEMALM